MAGLFPPRRAEPWGLNDQVFVLASGGQAPVVREDACKIGAEFECRCKVQCVEGAEFRYADSMG